LAAGFALGFRDAVEVVARRLLLVLGVTAAISCAAALVIAYLPDVYVASSVIYLDQAQLPRSYTQQAPGGGGGGGGGGVVPALAHVIGPLQKEALSRESLRRLVNDLGLYETRAVEPGEDGPGSAPTAFLERLTFRDPIERAREDITIDVARRFNQDFVEITVRARTADLAARAVNRITDTLATKNRELRIQRAEDASAFLDAEIAKARDRLGDEEARREAFRLERLEGLPENEAALFERVFDLRTRTEARRREIDDAVAARTELELRIHTILTQGQDPAAAEREGLLTLLRDLEKLEFDHAARGFKEGHPDVLSTRRQKERIQARLAAIGTGPRPGAPAPPPVPGAPPPARPAPAGPGLALPPPFAAAPGRDGGSLPASMPVAGAPAPAFRLDDAREVVSRLIESGTPMATVDAVQTLMGDAATLARRVETLLREQEQDLVELERFERSRGTLGTTRLELDKLDAAVALARRSHDELVADWRSVQKFLGAERELRNEQLRVIEAAEAPLMPAEPNRVLFGSLALAAALAAGIATAWLAELKKRRETYGSRDDVEEDLELPVLAVLPTAPNPNGAATAPRTGFELEPDDGPGDGLDLAFAPGAAGPSDDDLPIVILPDEDPVTPRGVGWHDRALDLILFEQFHRLRHSICGPLGAGEVRTVLVTSAVQGEGKSTVALGLAAALARSLDHRSLLVETDLRNPSIAARLGLPNEPGLAEHIVEDVPLAETIRTGPHRKMSVICAGRSLSAPAANVVASGRMARLVGEVRARYDDRIVVLDAPPIVSAPETLGLAELVDGIILVVRAGRTPREIVRQALRSLRRERVLGIVLNHVDLGRRERGYYLAYTSAARRATIEERPT